jgi:hypothetical protein
MTSIMNRQWQVRLARQTKDVYEQTGACCVIFLLDGLGERGLLSS